MRILFFFIYTTHALQVRQYMPKPVVKHFQPKRLWNNGTPVNRVIQREFPFYLSWSTFWVVSCSKCFVLQIENVWAIYNAFVMFILSFFFQRAYTFWRDMYITTRQIQGRLNDIGLLVSIHLERDDTGEYTSRAKCISKKVARLSQLFHVLFYTRITNDCTTLETLYNETGLMTLNEYTDLLKSTSRHQTVVAWLGILLDTSIQNEYIRGGSLLSYQFSTLLTTLRSTYAGLEDALVGRMSFYVAHLAQLSIDVLCLSSPFALMKFGNVCAILGSCFLCVFYYGAFNLAMILLNPFENDEICCETLLYETKKSSQRWMTHVEKHTFPFYE